MSELEIYKKKKLNTFRNIYNNELKKLNELLKTNLSKISRLCNCSDKKQQLINTVKSQYNIDVTNLNNKYKDSVQKILNYVPNKYVVNKKNINKALLVGINYRGTNNQLNGCINDIESIMAHLARNWFDVKILTDDTFIKPTKKAILSNLITMLKESIPGDTLVFAYSGHGSNTLDRNKDEITGYDQTIVPIDLKMIIDDELKDIIVKYLKKDVTLFAMFDCCYSGTVLDLRYTYIDSLNYDNFTENEKQLETAGNVIMISGCTDKQTSTDAFIDGKASGAMTWSCLKTLKESPNITWRELIKSMRNKLKQNGYSQLPQLSTGNFENIDSPVFI